MEIRVFSDLGDGDLRSAWGRLEDAGACPHVFASYPWVSAWSRQFAADGEPLVIVGYDGTGPVALAPLFADARGVVGLPVNFLSPRGEFLLLGDGARPFVPASLRLLRERGLRPVLRSVPRESASFGLLSRSARGAGYYVSSRPGRAAPYLDVTMGWDEYLATLPRKRTVRWERQVRRLEREGEVRIRELESGTNVHDLVTGFADLETRTWKEQQGTSIRGRGLEAFYQDLCRTLCEAGMLRPYWLELKGRMVAFLIGVAYRGTYFTLKTSYDEAFAKLSPGGCLFYLVIREQFRSGISRIDFIGEQARWKDEWATGHREHADLVLHPMTPRGTVSYVLDARVKPLARRLRRLAPRRGPRT